MIITRLTGGLGNQMFQYTAGRSLAEKNKTDLSLDILGYKNQAGITPRQYALNIFNVKENFLEEKDLNFLVKFFNEGKLGKLCLKIYSLLPTKYRYYIKEPYFNFYSQIFNTSKNVYLDGYWQSEKYFFSIENIIRQEFTLKDEYSKKLDKNLVDLIAQVDSVSLHIRRSDYITSKAANQTHGTCSIQYYEKAMEKIALTVFNPHFFVFSDDIEWVKNNLKFNYPVNHVSNGVYKDYEELFFMSKCKHNIIANSSFSWWGAWLNKNKNKIVIAPVNWFNDKKFNTRDLIPETWIKI